MADLARIRFNNEIKRIKDEVTTIKEEVYSKLSYVGGVGTQGPKGDKGDPGDPANITLHESAYNHSLIHSNTLDHSNYLDHSNSQDHSHNNKTLLDSYAQTEASLADAVTKKHDSAHNHDTIYEQKNTNIQVHVTSAHSPSDAQKNSDITKGEIETKLTGPISTHTHAGGVAWGAITGTLSGQADLNDSLTAKQPRGYAALANDTLALALATNFVVKLTVTAARTLTTTVPTAGTRCTIIILTSGTTSRVITFGTGFKSVGTLATGTVTGRVFVINWISDGTNLYEAGRTAAMAA